MARKISVVVLLVFVCFACVSGQQPGKTSTRYQALLDLYEGNDDLAWAYRLAVVANAESNYEAAVDWLEVLSRRSWRMGVDPGRFKSRGINRKGLGLVESLNALADKSGIFSNIAFQIDDATLIPESIAYDSKRRVLYAGSLSQSKVVAFRFAQDGASFSTQDIGVDRLGAVYGIKWDEQANELWVLHNRWVENRLTGSLTVFDANGDVLREFNSYVLGDSELNDLCLTKDSVFVTDSRNDSVLQGDRSGSALRPFVVAGDMPYANGIACNETSDKVFVAGATGVHAFDIKNPNEMSRIVVPSGFSLGGIDGLYVHENSLIGIQNALGAPKVVFINFDKNYRATSVRFRDVLSPDFRIPTTGFLEGDCLIYIGNSSLDVIGPDYAIDYSNEAPDQALILGLPIDDVSQQCAAL